MLYITFRDSTFGNVTVSLSLVVNRKMFQFFNVPAVARDFRYSSSDQLTKSSIPTPTCTRKARQRDLSVTTSAIMTPTPTPPHQGHGWDQFRFGRGRRQRFVDTSSSIEHVDATPTQTQAGPSEQLHAQSQMFDSSHVEMETAISPISALQHGIELEDAELEDDEEGEGDDEEQGDEEGEDDEEEEEGEEEEGPVGA